MAKGPRDPREIFPEITGDYKAAYGQELVSLILYGSGAGQDYRPGESDINFMVVLSDRGVEDLEKAFDIVKKWRKQHVATPLFLTERYLETSVDVFPIEYLNFRHNYVLVHGKDILRDLVIEPDLLRLQCEREIKGKLLLLRQAFLESSGKGKHLKEVIGHSIRAFSAIFKALLHLEGEAVPRGKLEVLRKACKTFGLDMELFENLLDASKGSSSAPDDETVALFRRYLAAVNKLANLVDTWGG